MFVCEIDADKLVGIAGKNFTDLIQRLSGNDDLSVLIGVIQFHIADGDAVSVERYHSEPVVPNL